MSFFLILFYNYINYFDNIIITSSPLWQIKQINYFSHFHYNLSLFSLSLQLYLLKEDLLPFIWKFIKDFVQKIWDIIFFSPITVFNWIIIFFIFIYYFFPSFVSSWRSCIIIIFSGWIFVMFLVFSLFFQILLYYFAQILLNNIIY